MREGWTELVFLLDRSGSMSGLESDTIGGFNEMIERQRKEQGSALVTTVLFDDQEKLLHDRVPLDEVRPMTERDYQVRGCTALLDALGGAIERIGMIHHYARPEDVPEKTIFVVTTDGLENASSRYRLEQVKEMVRDRQKEGWEFLFLGASIESVTQAEGLGIEREYAAVFMATPQGVRESYAAMSDAVCAMRSGERAGERWKAGLSGAET